MAYKSIVVIAADVRFVYSSYTVDNFDFRNEYKQLPLKFPATSAFSPNLVL